MGVSVSAGRGERACLEFKMRISVLQWAEPNLGEERICLSAIEQLRGGMPPLAIMGRRSGICIHSSSVRQLTWTMLSECQADGDGNKTVGKRGSYYPSNCDGCLNLSSQRKLLKSFQSLRSALTQTSPRGSQAVLACKGRWFLLWRSLSVSCGEGR